MSVRQFFAALFFGSFSSYAILLGVLILSNSARLSAETEPVVAIIATGTATRSNTQLIEFVRLVVKSSPEILAAQSHLNASNAIKSAAGRALYNPAIELGFEETDISTRTLAISQTIDLGQKRSARIAFAEANRLAAEAEYALTRRTVIGDILSSLALYQTAVDQEALSTEQVRLTREFSTLAKKRFDSGDIPVTELNLANLAYAQSRIKQAGAATELIDARQQIHALTTLSDPNRWPKLQTQLPAPAGYVDIQATLAGLPEVQMAQRQFDAASASVDLRQREKRPDPTISFTGGKEGDESLFGLSLSFDLPARNSYSHEVTAAYEESMQAQQLAYGVRQQAAARLQSATERYKIALNAWNDWQQNGPQSLKQQSEQLQRLWQAGELGSTDYLIQSGQTLDIRDSAFELRQSLWLAWIDWLTASGQIDQWHGSETSWR